MLLQFDPEKHGAVKNFQELYHSVVDELRSIEGVKTMVLGPVTAKDRGALENNLLELRIKARKLSSKWVVLDLPSFQKIIESLVRKTGTTGYPYIILEEFTIPLIKSGVFKTLFVRKGYENSIGATIEHDMALANDIAIVYFE